MVGEIIKKVCLGRGIKAHRSAGAWFQATAKVICPKCQTEVLASGRVNRWEISLSRSPYYGAQRDSEIENDSHGVAVLYKFMGRSQCCHEYISTEFSAEILVSSLTEESEVRATPDLFLEMAHSLFSAGNYHPRKEVIGWYESGGILSKSSFEALIQMGVKEEDILAAEEKLYHFLCEGGCVPYNMDQVIEILRR